MPVLPLVHSKEICFAAIEVLPRYCPSHFSRPAKSSVTLLVLPFEWMFPTTRSPFIVASPDDDIDTHADKGKINAKIADLYEYLIVRFLCRAVM